MLTRRRRGHALDLPEPCRRCTYWEDAHGRRGTDVPDDEAEAAREAKQRWWDEAAQRWHPVGLEVVRGDEVVGFALLGPGDELPRVARLGGTSEDAWCLAMLWAQDDDEAVAAALVRDALEGAAAGGARALEAFAGPPWGADCHPKRVVLERAGFARLRPAGAYTLLRLDLRQVPGLLDRLRQAAQGLEAVVRQRRGAPTLPAADAWSPRTRD